MELELIQALGKIIDRLDALESKLPAASVSEPPAARVADQDDEPLLGERPPLELVQEPAAQPSELGAAFRARAAVVPPPSLPSGYEWDAVGGAVDVPVGAVSSGHHLTDAQISAMYLREQRARVHPVTVEDELARRSG
jgi:hypothetical protein